MKKQRLVVGISGSSGAILGIRLLAALRETSIETHLVITPSARLTIEQETGWKTADVLALAKTHYSHRDTAAPIASGSFESIGMVIIPCSVKSLSAIANSYSADLLSRAADVSLKEGRPLILVFREAPLHSGHIRLMEQAAASGAILFPPVPAFYTHPQTVDDIVDNIVGRVLRRLGIENDLYQQWMGIETGRVDLQKPGGLELPEKKPLLTIEKDYLDLPAMSVATVGKIGMPYAATVYFAVGQDYTLYFFSTENSQHSINLAANPRAAVTIQPMVETWQEIHGLQLQGLVRKVSPGEEWEQALALYCRKFPFATDLKDIIAKNTLYAFEPDWVRHIDNRRGFGFTEEWTNRA